MAGKFQIFTIVTTLAVGLALPLPAAWPEPQFLGGRPGNFPVRPVRPLRPTPSNPWTQPAAVPDASGAAGTALTGDAAHQAAQNPFGQLGQGAAPSSNVGHLVGILNNGQVGSASAGGAGNGAVGSDGTAIGQGTGVANAGPGGFGIGLGIGGAISTPLGNLAFGQGDSVSVGK